MSYFFNSYGTGDVIKSARRKHGKHRSKSQDRDIEHNVKYWKHSSKKCILKPKSILYTNRNDSYPSQKSRSKRCLHKEIERLKEENELLKLKIEGTELNPNSSPLTVEEDSMLRKKFQILQETHYKTQAEYQKVNFDLAQYETEHKLLNAQNEELKLMIRNVEQERNNFSKDVQTLKYENNQLHEDMNLLKNVIYCLNVEIEKYQNRIRTLGCASENRTVNITDEVESVSKNDNIVEAWGKVNFHALGPLLDSYQENLREKNGLIEKYKKELDEFSGRLREVIAENEDLHNEIEILKIKCKKIIEERNIIEKDASIIKQQNDLLNKQSILQTQKIKEIHFLYEQKVESMSQDNNKLHNNYLSCKTELSNLKGKYEILDEEYEKLKSKSEKTMSVSVHNSAVEECKHIFEERKQQYEQEIKKLNNRIKLLEMNERKMQKKLECLQKTIHSIRNSRDSFKRQLHETTLHCEKLANQQDDLLSERNKLVQLLEEKGNIHHLKSNITKKIGVLKDQLKVYKEETEKHMRNQETGSDQIKAEYQREIQRLKYLLLQKEEIIQMLQREKHATQSNLELILKSAMSGNKISNNILKPYYK